MTVARSTANQTNTSADILLIGRILGAHGLTGEVKVFPLTDDIQRFKQLEDCLLLSENQKDRVPARAAGARFLNTQVLLHLQGFEDRTAAETLKGRYLAVTRDKAVKLPPDTWFICDLIGCEVYDSNHGHIGRLADVMPNAAHDVYLIQAPGLKDLLFPALKTILHRVDLEGRRIDVVLPDGLYEIYRT